MNKAVMRFGGFLLDHNPKTLKVKRKKSLVKQSLNNGESRAAAVKDSDVIITGTAELYGDSCFEEYAQLLSLKFQNKVQILAIPGVGAFSAVLTELILLAEPKHGVISLEFRFDTVCGTSDCTPISKAKTTTVQHGESLWDIAYRCGVQIEKLAELNPIISDVFDLSEGDELILC